MLFLYNLDITRILNINNVFIRSLSLSLFYLKIRSVDSELCLDTNGAQNDPTHATMGMEGCHGMGGNQLFRINTKGQLVVEDGFCLYARPNTEKLIFAKCTAEKSFTSETTMWDYDSVRF